MSEENKNLTMPETARKILGAENFIGLDEAVKIFARKKGEATGYDLVPFSKELLWRCSQAEIPFILIPGLDYIGKNIKLSIYEIHDLLRPRYDFFGPWDEVAQFKPQFIYKSVCEPRWYLLSGDVWAWQDIQSFCVKHEYACKNFEYDHAVVYIYAWLLFKLLRKKNIFTAGPARCDDDFSETLKTRTYLNFASGKINISQWRPKSRKNEIAPGFISSVDPYTE